MRLFAITLLAALAFPAAGHAEVFRYKYRPGQVVLNRVNMAGASMAGPPGGAMVKAQFRMSVRQTQRVRSVGGGIVTLEVAETTVSGQTTSNGKTESVEKSTTRSLVRMTERGRFLSRTPVGEQAKDEESSEIEGTDALFGLNFPARNVTPGERWADTITVPAVGGARKVQVTTHYVGREKFRGRNCARFSSVLSLPMTAGAETGAPEGVAAQGKISATVTTYFDPEAGVEVYSSGSLVLLARADLSKVSPEAGELATVSKINMIQSLAGSGARKK